MRDVPGASLGVAAKPMLNPDCWNNGGGCRRYGDRGVKIGAMGVLAFSIKETYFGVTPTLVG